MKLVSTFIVAGTLVGGVLATAPAAARMADPGLKAPAAVDQVACRTVRERVRGPRGAWVWRSRTVCTPAVVRPRPRCFTERQRIVRPNGTVVFKSTRVCR